jgi:hypothetical protein
VRVLRVDTVQEAELLLVAATRTELTPESRRFLHDHALDQIGNLNPNPRWRVLSAAARIEGDVTRRQVLLKQVMMLWSEVGPEMVRDLGTHRPRTRATLAEFLLKDDADSEPG